ncbi:MAG TPA: glycosyltransferase family A protein [Rhodothermales bacterium]|nr:glycosyltransferase family A protein [Rhodothermales bacterium]
MDIAIIIPVHNGGAAFERCLEGVAASSIAPAEIIVVPDGESDGSWQAAEQYGARVLEPTPAPRGPAHARNRGAEAAVSEILFFVDADVVVHPNALEEITAAFCEDPDLDALIGSYDDAPGAPGFLSQYRNLLHHYTHQVSTEEASTFWGACGAVRRTVFEAVGGFDAKRFALPSVEDIELGYRLRNAGYTLKLRKTLLVKHLKRWNARSIVRTDVFCRALPWTELILEYGALENNLNLRNESRFSVLAVGALLLTLTGSFVWPLLAFAAFAVAAMLLILNAPVYRFFLRKRGIGFTLGVIPWHWFYFFYGGVGFALGIMRHRRTVRPHKAIPVGA